ncbi:hypothetical protein H17ap60334_07193 [Thermosipho africanus H17ap60334]|jgi:hypothetical protein|uniref:hypothetical protein n=1 Tax=Thermosipho TaxID=2420 RepID=UPI00028C4626|nr:MULTISPECIES: hypothetical protein [Thermosipho]EKF49159.1 hypothetical protein H17ap60334_07193 [Thermosipho africanus H17ap60334]MBZ4649613.1 hypothetical protein [Thermosipho sp. (in: thermotogales)]
MKRYLILILFIISTLALSFTLKVEAGNADIPFVMKMSDFLDYIPEDVDPYWDAIRVKVDGNYVPFQIDDVDGNRRISGDDYLMFLAHGNCEIIIPENEMGKVEFESYFKVSKDGKNWIISGENGETFKIDDHGLVHVTKYGSVEGILLDEIGILRVAGFANSTYYVNGELGKHFEEVSYAFEPVSIKVITGPVAFSVYTKLRSITFSGLDQYVATHVFKNGDILVDNNVSFRNYADLMKLQHMVTRVLTSIDGDALHVLPVFRKLVWADQLNITPYEYWSERKAIRIVNNKPYIVFPAKDSMKPLWWGATYIFASEERWRGNYSEKFKLGIAEILPEIPVVKDNFVEWINGNTWVFESQEFRDGIFKWIPGEFEAFEATKGAYPTDMNYWPNRYYAGQQVNFKRLYSINKSNSLEEWIKFLEVKSDSFRRIKIVK